MKGLSVRTKLTLTVAGLAFLIVFGVFAYHTYEIGESSRNAAEETSVLFVTLQASKALDLLLTEDVNILRSQVDEIKKHKDVLYCVFVDREGKPIADSFNGKIPAYLKDKLPPAKEFKTVIKRPDGSEILHIVEPIQEYGALAVGFKRTPLKEFILAEVEDFWWVFAISLFTALVLSLFIS
ncbi:MAG: hypothetical protein D6778_06195, partial [Nitrospirae bacterium]